MTATFAEDKETKNNSFELLWTFVNSENDKRPDILLEFLATPGLNPSIHLEESDIKDFMFFIKLLLTDNLLTQIRDCMNSRAWKDAEFGEM